MRFHCNLNHH